MLGAGETRRLAAELDLRPSKGRGQNFVVDPATVRRIARLAGTGPGDVVLEVGPGLGALTLALLESGAEVVAVEIDDRLAARLPATATAHLPGAGERLRVLHADAVTVTPAALPPGPAPRRLVANLPYNVAVPILLEVLHRFPGVADGVVMVQSEVADRLTAGPGNRVYGVPSVKLAWYAEARRAGTVPASVFWPVPHVGSGLVAFTRRPGPLGEEWRERTFACVDAAFAQRRKILRGALAPLAGSADAAGTALAAAGIPPTARGEQLTVGDFARIATALASDAPAAR